MGRPTNIATAILALLFLYTFVSAIRLTYRFWRGRRVIRGRRGAEGEK